MKYVFCLFISVFAGLVTASLGQAQQSKIQVFKLETGVTVIVVQSMTSKSVEAARRELMPEAKRICGAQPIWFGDYQFDSGGRNGPFLLMQPIRCVDPTQAPTTVVKDPTWRPTERQQAIILELTRRYFRMKDARDYDQVRQMLANELPYADWLAAAETFNKQSGPVRYRGFSRVTWYVNPVNAFAPGLYAAVDFHGQFDHIDTSCGFVMWYRGQDGVTRLLREEQNYISRERQQSMSADELAALRKKWGC
jgi:hypothetical protein